MLLFIIIIAYLNSDNYSDLRKRFKGHSYVVPEPFEIKNITLLFMVHLILVKTTFIKKEWKGYNVYCIDDLKLLDNLDSFANSLIIFDDMGDNIRLPAIDSLYSKGRHRNINIICVGHTVTDLYTKARDNTPAIYIFININSSQQFFERVQEKLKIDSNLYRFKLYKYGKINYNNVSDYYIVLDKDKNVVYDSRIGDLYIEKYVEYTEFKEKEYNILISYLIDRMLEPTHIKPNELMFYFEEYLEFKGKNRSFNFYKTYTNLKSIFNEIHKGYVAIFVVISVLGIGYSYYQKCGNNNDYNIKNNINGIDIMDIDEAKIKLRNGKKVTIGYGLIDEDKIDLNDPFNIIYMLAISLESFYAAHNVIHSKTKNDDNM